MKTRRLLEVDLAKLATLPLAEQRLRMHRLIGGGGRFSFKPTRDQFADILNVQPPMFAPLGEAPKTDFVVIEEKLRKTCRSVEELIFNIQAARMLHSHFRTSEVVSRPFSFGHLAVGLDRGIQYWVQSFYARDGLPVVTFIDPRGGQGLTRPARDVVFSAMHASVRERQPDFGNAVLEIIQLPYDRSKKDGESNQRKLQVHTLSDDPVYNFAAIDRMFTATLRLWDIVCAEAAEDKKRKASGTGPLL